MSVEVLDPVEDARWTALLDASPDASVFHHPLWLQLLKQQYGYRIEAWCVPGAGDAVSAGLPVAEIRSRLTGRRLVALPFSDVCPPLGEPASLARAVASRREREGLPLEVHDALPGMAGARMASLFLTHRLELGRDPGAVQEGIKASNLRNARKARERGLRVQRRIDREALDIFYGLHLKTRRRQGVPTQPKAFIRRFERLFDKGLGFVAIAGSSQGPAAAAVFLSLQGTLTYKYGASDPTRLAQRPNDLIFLEVIRWACAEGYRTLDFGRTDRGNEGLARFKRSWGPQERRLSYTFLGKDAPGAGEGRAQRLAGAVIRRAPVSAGRLAGELLYKHYG